MADKHKEEECMSKNKRTIELFTAGCPICSEMLELVRQTVAGCGCEVIERRCQGETCCELAKQYGVKTLPTIVINGKVAFEGRPTPERTQQLLAA
jgi:hypothetical protein